jgi:hypothetical protein
MDIFETIGWIALGFIPTLAGMELAWRTSTKKFNQDSQRRSETVLAEARNRKQGGFL